MTVDKQNHEAPVLPDVDRPEPEAELNTKHKETSEGGLAISGVLC